MKLLICTQAVDENHPILGFFIGWIKEFAQHFEEVHVICLQKGQYELPPHVHVYSLGKEAGENRLKYVYRFYKYFGHLFFGVRIDYVFFHMGEIYNIIAAPFFFIRRPFHTKFYWWKAHGRINFLGRCALALVDAVYTSTESGFNIDTPKRRIVGQAIDTSLFVFPQEHAVRHDEIIFVGRIMPVKHIEDFIDAAYILHPRFPSTVFKIYGPVGDEDYFEKLKEQIEAHGLQNTVLFMGPKTQAELIVVYQQSAVFLNTSLTHSMDKTVLEAALCGCIPVTGNRAFAELLYGGGSYIENATPERYATSVSTFLQQQNGSLQTKLREMVIKLHSLDTFTKRIFNI